MMRKIYLHANLTKLGGSEPIILDAGSVAEAISGLQRARKGLFKPDLLEGTQPTVKLLGYRADGSRQTLDTPELITKESDFTEIHVFPALRFGKSGFVQIIVGAVLIALAVFQSELIPAFLGQVGITAGMVGLMGVGLVLGGVSQLLFPSKISDLQMSDLQMDEGDYLGAAQNTIAVGTRVPLAFGCCMVHGHFLSYSVEAINTNS
jgi:predicted phage tail protein